MTDRASRRTQAERRSESGRGLLDSAVDLIASQGVGAVTFEAIGRNSGFSRGLATQRFGSKQKLIEALLDDLYEHEQARLQERALDDLPGLEAVMSYVDLCLGNLVANDGARAYFRLLSSSVAEANSLREAFRERHAEVEAQLIVWLTKGQAQGAIRPDLDPSAAALMIGCLVFGMSMQLLVDPSMDVGPIRETSLAMLRMSLALPAS
jgi:AcrR family transcriptional regulator